MLTLQVKMSGSMKCEVDVVAAHCYNIDKGRWFSSEART